MSARLVRYRVDVSVQGLRYGEIVEIDPTHEGWKPLIAKGYLREAPPELQVGALDADLSAAIDELAVETKPEPAKRSRSRSRTRAVDDDEPDTRAGEALRQLRETHDTPRS